MSEHRYYAQVGGGDHKQFHLFRTASKAKAYVERCLSRGVMADYLTPMQFESYEARMALRGKQPNVILGK